MISSALSDASGGMDRLSNHLTAQRDKVMYISKAGTITKSMRYEMRERQTDGPTDGRTDGLIYLGLATEDRTAALSFLRVLKLRISSMVSGR